MPKHLGFNHISRQSVISDHTWHLAQFLFGDQGDPRAILVIDGTYIFIYRILTTFTSKEDLQHAQRSSSCEAYVISTTSGYFLSILGPYLADSKNSDAAILNHAIAKSVDTIRVKEEDVMVEGFGTHLRFWRTYM